MRAWSTRCIAERRRPIRTVLQLAQLRGEISPDLDLDAALAMIVGPFTYRRMVERREVTPEFKDQVLRGAVAALRSTAFAPVRHRLTPAGHSVSRRRQARTSSRVVRGLVMQIRRTVSPRHVVGTTNADLIVEELASLHAQYVRAVQPSRRNTTTDSSGSMHELEVGQRRGSARWRPRWWRW